MLNHYNTGGVSQVSDYQWDFWGEQIRNAIAFFDSGFKTNLELTDSIQDELSVKSADMFERKAKRWFMRQDSIPGQLGVKSIGVDDKGLYFETAPLDPVKVQEIIEEYMLPLRYSQTRGVILDATTKKIVARITPARENQLKTSDGFVFAPRCLWIIDLPKLDDHRRTAVVQLADLIYTHEAFVEEAIVEAEGLSRLDQAAAKIERPKMKLELNLSLQQRLMMEQRPVLSVSGRTEGRLELNIGLSVMLGMQQKILLMNEDQLIAFTEVHVSHHGENATARLFDFVIAGKIKAVRPELNWKQARKVGRQLTTKKPVRRA